MANTRIKRDLEDRLIDRVEEVKDRMAAEDPNMKSKRERAAAAKKRGKVSSEDSDVQAGILAAQMPPPMEVAGQEQDEIWKLQAQVQLRRNCRFHFFGF